jgi:hypothetical protein
MAASLELAEQEILETLIVAVVDLIQAVLAVAAGGVLRWAQRALLQLLPEAVLAARGFHRRLAAALQITLAAVVAAAIPA